LSAFRTEFIWKSDLYPGGLVSSNTVYIGFIRLTAVLSIRHRLLLSELLSKSLTVTVVQSNYWQ